MIDLLGQGARIYLLPEDGPAARAAFIDLLRVPGETWISAYALTDSELIAEILAADARGIPVHLLLDHSQAMGHVEAPKVKALASSLRCGDLTITTAGIGSATTGAIWHDKALVTRASDGGEDFVWWGSVNFSDSGWGQGNLAQILRSSALSSAIIAQMAVHVAWARAHEPQYQIAAARIAH